MDLCAFQDGITSTHYALVGRTAEQPYGHFPFYGKNSYHGGVDLEGRRHQQQQQQQLHQDEDVDEDDEVI